jgi:hypothetical protein
MFRAAIVVTVMFVVAWPPGICICRYFHSQPVETTPCCACAEPAQPSDDQDDHEDCICWQREVLSCDAAPEKPLRDSNSSLDCAACGSGLIVVLSDATSLLSLHATRSYDPPPTLIPCALRI